MADVRQTHIPTGGKEDLQVDSSRCLRMRYSESTCRRCAVACPHGAVGLDGGLSINASRCTGCMLCTVECPSGALEQNHDFSACLAKLARVPGPILGCHRTKDCSHATLACLGGLSEEHLVALCRSLSGTVMLNLTACGDCPNSTVSAQLRKRLATIACAGLSDSRCSIVIVQSQGELNFSDVTVDRRSFFRAFGNSIFKSAAVVLSSTLEQAERRSDYAGKRAPVRRELLNKIRNGLSEGMESRLRRHFDFCISFDEVCSTCHGCVAICPTGALRREQAESPPAFDDRLCTGCGLCSEFCLDGALTVDAFADAYTAPVKASG